MPLFKTDGTIVPAYHQVYIKDNKEPLVPQQKLEWEIVTPRPDEVHNTCNCKGAYVHQVPL